MPTIAASANDRLLSACQHSGFVKGKRSERAARRRNALPAALLLTPAAMRTPMNSRDRRATNGMDASGAHENPSRTQDVYMNTVEGATAVVERRLVGRI